MDNYDFDIYKGYTIIDGFGFTHVTYPGNVHDGIIIKCTNKSDCESPQYEVPNRSISDYVKYINDNNIEKAAVIMDNIAFLKECKSLKYLSIAPSYEAGEDFDFTPIYELPEVKFLSCQNQYDEREQYNSEIDYRKVHGLVSLNVSINKGSLNFNKVDTLESLAVYNFYGKERNLKDLFCSKQLDTLSIIQCGIKSLSGIEMSKSMQCLYLHYNRSLADISALRKVKKTLKALRIENAPKIVDFTVLSELENLELLELTGKNVLPNLNFLRTMKNLKTFTFNMNVLDGDLSLCDNLSYVYSEIDRKHYNLKDKQLPKGNYIRGNEAIEEWRKLE